MNRISSMLWQRLPPLNECLWAMERQKKLASGLRKRQKLAQNVIFALDRICPTPSDTISR
jgi:hypothetical protein